MVTAGGVLLPPSGCSPPQQRVLLLRSPELKEFKQVRAFTKAEDTGLSCVEFYSAGMNPHDLLAEFLFLKTESLQGSLIDKTEKGDASHLMGSGSGKLGLPMPTGLGRTLRTSRNRT